jgi:hypothetical protein
VRKSVEIRWAEVDPGVIHRGLCVLGIVILVAGCHARQRTGNRTLLERISGAGGSGVQAPRPGELAEDGETAITEQCGKQSYKTASQGLIVSETGLHEDVFALRNRVSYGEMAYGLDEALRLESLLLTEANRRGQSSGQADCIREFAEHLESLTDPMVEADARLKELDASAFKDAAREADEQAEKTLREPEMPAVSKAQP